MKPPLPPRTAPEVVEHVDIRDLSAQVLDIVQRLVRELRGDAAGSRVSLDARLEQDLGVTSLERTELVGRLERRFGHPPGDPALVVAETARALAQALSRQGTRHTSHLRGALELPGDIRPAPRTARTLTAVLEWHAAAHPDRAHLVLRHDDRDEMLTFGDLHREATRVAAGLRAGGVRPRDTVAIMLRSERGFFQALFGVLLAGAVPVPMYPPFRPDRIADYVARQTGILENAEARVLVTFDRVEALAKLLRERLSHTIAVTSIDELGSSGAPDSEARPLDSTAGALIQYTSGSTGDPKGVFLTHDNLLANIRAVGSRLELRDGDRVVSWLPLYHDMGLIGSWLGSLYFGLPLVVMSPLMFLSQPVRWLRTLSEYRGTISPGPNFAFDLCTRRVTDEELAGVDLSSVRLLLNGSEAVLPATLQRFAGRFGPHGLRPSALYPVYGLAECAVGLTAPAAGAPLTIDHISRESLATKGAPLSSELGPSVSVVSCGRPLDDHEVRIVDDDGAPVVERIQGQVEFRGPSASAGYYRRPEETRAIKTADGWTRTGDLGYLSQGDLFITGRRKDIIIRAGRNLYPQELEDISSRVPGVRAGCVAAFGRPSDVSGTERVVVVAETREVDDIVRGRISQVISSAIAEAIGIPPDEVHLVRPGAVLKTSSGKIRRAATRDALLAGRLSDASGSARGQWMTVAMSALAGRLRRSGSTALAVVHTAYLCALLALALPALCALLATSDPRTCRRRLRMWCRGVVLLSWCRLDVVLDQIPAERPLLLVANHASYLDPIWLLASLPIDVRFAAKAQLARYPVLGLVLRRCGFVLLERGDHDERLASAGSLERALEGGVALALFPEGTFVRSFGLLPFKLGGFRAAASTAALVVPIGIAGARAVFPDGAWVIRPGPIRVSGGAPTAVHDPSWNGALRLRDQMRDQIARLSGELATQDDSASELFSAM